MHLSPDELLLDDYAIFKHSNSANFSLRTVNVTESCTLKKHRTTIVALLIQKLIKYVVFP